MGWELTTNCRSIVVKSKDKTDKKNMCNIIAEKIFPDCPTEQTYLGEFSGEIIRALGARLKEYATNRDDSQQLEKIE